MKTKNMVIGLFVMMVALFATISCAYADPYWNGDRLYPYADETDNAYIYVKAPSIEVLRRRPYDFKVTIVTVDKNDPNLVYGKQRINFIFYPETNNPNNKTKVQYDDDGDGTFRIIDLRGKLDYYDSIMVNVLWTSVQCLKTQGRY